MDLIDEVIGYAKANAESGKTADERDTWLAHQHNCIRVKAEIERLQEAKRRALDIADERAKEAAALRAALEAIAKMPDRPPYSPRELRMIKLARATLEQSAPKEGI